MKPKMSVIRQIKVTTPKVIPLVTEELESSRAILRHDGNVIEVKGHVLTRPLMKFLEQIGVEIESIPDTRLRGVAEINGIKVKVLPINRTNYDKGAFIQVYEESDTSWKNTNKITKTLADNGIDWEKECLLTEEKVCTIKK